MGTSSADPDRLRAYADETLEGAEELRRRGSALSELLAAFNAQPKETGASVPDHGQELLALAARMDELDSFVGDVGRAFAEVDAQASAFGVVSAAHDAVARRVELWQAYREAEDPEVFAQRVRELLDTDPFAEPADLDAWLVLAGQLAPLVEHPEFAARFLSALGAEGTAQVPMSLERAWAESEAGRYPYDPAPAWEALQVFSGLLASASRHLAASGDPLRVGDQTGRLPRSFIRDLLAVFEETAGHHGMPPHAAHLGLLLVAGGLSDHILAPVARFAEEVLAERPGMLLPFGGLMTPWGQFNDPAYTLLPAVAESPMAAASQPRLFAQLLAIGQLSPGDLDIAMLEAARRSHRDPDWQQAHLAELTRLGLFPEEHVNDYGDALLATGLALGAANAGHDTIAALRDRASDAGRNMTHPDPAVRSQASRTLRDTPPWLRQVVRSRGFDVAARGLPAAGVGLDLVGHLADGRDAVEAAARTGGGLAGAWAAGKVAAKTGSPLLAKGPPGWVGYGALMLTSTTAGAIFGDRLVGWLAGDRPQDRLWAVPDDPDRGLPRPTTPQP